MLRNLQNNEAEGRTAPEAALFDNHAETYDETLANSTRWVSNDTNYFAEHKVLQIQRHITFAPKRILDYGCGIGRNIPFLIRYFPQAACYGCDISEKSLAVARSRNPTAVFFQNHAKHEHGEFDLIVVANVFHHVVPDERDRVVKQLKELLAFEGALFVFEHNPLNPLTRRSVRQCPFDKDAQLVTPRRLLALFLKQEYQVQRRKYTLFFPKWLSGLSWIEPYLGWLPLGAQYFLQVKKS